MEDAVAAEHKAPNFSCPNCQANSTQFNCTECVNEAVFSHAQLRAKLIQQHRRLEERVNDVLLLRRLQAEESRAEINQLENTLKQLERTLVKAAQLYANEVESVKKMDEYVTRWKEVIDSSTSSFIQNRLQWLNQLSDLELVFAFLQEKKDNLRKIHAERLDELLRWFRVYTTSDKSRSIMGIQVLDDFMSMSFKGEPEMQAVSTALGYICQLVMKISDLLAIPLTMTLHYQGSFSFVENAATGVKAELHMDYENPIPVDKFKSNVRLLDEVIISLCRSVGVPESRLRPYQMLYNILTLHEFLVRSNSVHDEKKHEVIHSPTEQDLADETDYEVIDKPLPPKPSDPEPELRSFSGLSTPQRKFRWW